MMKNVLIALRTSVKLIIVFIIATLLIASIIIFVYKPIYKVYLNGGQTIKAYDFNNPASGNNIEGNLLINNLGDVRLYVMFAGTLNSTFKCPKIDIYYVD